MPINPAELHAFLRERRSIRRFKPDPVPASILNEVLHTTTFAPSAHNRQPWRIAMIADSAIKLSLADAMGRKFRQDLQGDNLPEQEIRGRISRSRSRMSKAPVIIILCLDQSEMDAYPDLERKNAERMLAIQSTANAGLQLLLAAHAAGLGGCWLCSPMFAQEAIRRELNLPEGWEPQAMLLIGYADEHPEAKPRKPLEEIVLWIRQPPK